MSNLIIHLKGGAGNQLFQAAAIFSLANVCDKNCLFSIKNIGNNKYKRKLEIKNLLKDFGVKEKIINSRNKIIYLDEYDLDHPLYFSNSSPLATIDQDIQLEGYFTNYRIHDPDVINKMKSSIKNLYKIKKIKYSDYMTVHIRELHGTGSYNREIEIDSLNINYYSKALNKIVNNPTLSNVKNAIVFSDLWKHPENSKLLPQIKSILNKLGINYIDGDKEIKSPLEIIHIFLFSKCSIVSNSTLSWWGAYLSEGEIYSPVMSLWEPNLKIPDHWKQIYAGEITPRTHHKKIVFSTSINNQIKISRNQYSYKRLLIINLFRKGIRTLFNLPIFNLIFKVSKLLGFLPENSNKTFF